MQNLAGAVWWTAIELRLQTVRHRALGSLLAADALTLPGLNLTVLLAPVWAGSLGMAVARGRLRGGS